MTTIVGAVEVVPLVELEAGGVIQQHQYRRLRVRYERRDDIHEAFLAIGCSLICLKLLQAEESF